MQTLGWLLPCRLRGDVEDDGVSKSEKSEKGSNSEKPKKARGRRWFVELPLGFLKEDETHRIAKGAVVKCSISLTLVAEFNRLKTMSYNEFKNQLAVVWKSVELSWFHSWFYGSDLHNVEIIVIQLLIGFAL